LTDHTVKGDHELTESGNSVGLLSSQGLKFLFGLGLEVSQEGHELGHSISFSTDNTVVDGGSGLIIGHLVVDLEESAHNGGDGVKLVERNGAEGQGGGDLEETHLFGGNGVIKIADVSFGKGDRFKEGNKIGLLMFENSFLLIS
jgi:hypothetical protein